MARHWHNLLSAGALLSLALLAGRLAGFARELLLAATFGLSAQADMAVILLTMPDFLVNLLLSGGIGVALVPLMRTQSDAQAALLLRQASLLVGGLFAVLGLAVALLPTVWLRLLAPGIGADTPMLHGWTGYAVGATMLLTALSGVTSATLNARDHFFISGCGTLIFNTAIIFVLLWMLRQPSPALNVLSAGIAGGALLRWMTQWQALRPLRRQRITTSRWLIDRPLLKGFFAGLTAASLLVVVPVVLRACASLLGEGQLAAFNYAVKLVELPLGILITTIATVTFPKLSEAFYLQDRRAFDQLLAAAIGRSILLSLAVLLCGWPVIEAVVWLLLGYGKLGVEQLAHIAQLSRIALLSVPCVGLANILAAALNAQRRPGQVLRKTLLALLALPLLCLPGLWAGRPEWLIAALPAFYLLCCISLLVGSSCFMQKSHVHSWRVYRKAAMPFVLWVTAIAALGYILNGWLFDENLYSEVTSFSNQNRLLMLEQIALAGLLFSIMLVGGIRLLHHKYRY